MRELGDAIYGEAANAEQVLMQVESSNWDLVILDISMPGRSGLEVLGELARLKPKVRVLVLSVHAEDQYGRRVLKAGALGYLNKESTPEELLKAVQKVLAGGCYVSGALGEKLAQHLNQDSERAAHEALSAREFEILLMIASGKAVAQIATELRLGVTTVSTYRARVLEKLKLGTNADLIRYALQSRLVD
jgi:DNA-binding NarL/FixJ family response regulator